jgi:hypothetical protein
MAGKYERLTRSSRTCRRLRPSTTAGASIATNTMPATTPSVAGQPAVGIAQERGTDGVDAGEDREVEGQQSGDSASSATTRGVKLDRRQGLRNLAGHILR